MLRIHRRVLRLTVHCVQYLLFNHRYFTRNITKLKSKFNAHAQLCYALYIRTDQGEYTPYLCCQSGSDTMKIFYSPNRLYIVMMAT